MKILTTLIIFILTLNLFAGIQKPENVNIEIKVYENGPAKIEIVCAADTEIEADKVINKKVCVIAESFTCEQKDRKAKEFVNEKGDKIWVVKVYIDATPKEKKGFNAI
jgi:hypothetical protein